MSSSQRRKFLMIIMITYNYFLTRISSIDLLSSFTNSMSQEEDDTQRREAPYWMYSGKFQGDIDGVDEEMVKISKNKNIMYNALRNRQLTWSNSIVPYELDEAFTTSEVKLLQRAFKTYRRRTCVRFRLRRSEPDFLNIVKGHGCYSQVGRTGGKQEISLGRGCLFNETIIHELMHALGFWHEHSRSDRDEHIIIRYENILPGMDSQFDIVSAAIQDTLGESYDYRSIMHYGSSAFSKNGKNTIEAVEDEFTNVIGTASDLSELDVAKINKLYKCSRRDPKKISKIIRSKTMRNDRQNVVDGTPDISGAVPQAGDGSPTPPTKSQIRETSSVDRPFINLEVGIDETSECQDHFVDCPNFKDYCKKSSFFFIMKSYCPFTCGQCDIIGE